MRALRLSASAIYALLALAPASALAQPATVGGVLTPPIPAPGNGSLYPGNGSLFPTPMPPQNATRGPRGGLRGAHRGISNNFIYYEEPYAVHDVVVVHDQPAAAPEPPPPPPAPAPREAYVLGKSYASLPGGCMKMIESGASFYYCSGEWYRQIGEGSAVTYKAVAMP